MLPENFFAQKGKDGAEIIGTSGAIFNRYTTLAQTALAGNSFVVVSSLADLNGNAITGLQNNPYSTDGLEGCDLLMIIKMQGSSINSLNTPAYGDIANYNGVGDYEFFEIGSISGNTISLAAGCVLSNSYSVSTTQRVQVIRVPRLTSLSINAGASLSSRPWGQVANTGGVVAIETNGAVLINGSINVKGQGFRGGGATSAFASPGVTNYVSFSSSQGGDKGESIAGYQIDYNAFGGRYSRGAPANGGGGGNSINAGGGGGSNGGSLLGYTGVGNPDPTWASVWNLETPPASPSPGGGRGGYSQSLIDADAAIVGPGNVSWGGDGRNNIGGLGGKPLDNFSNTRLFMGGGGGAGHSDNGQSQDGARGGGIVFLTTDGTISGSGEINAEGDDALATLPTHIDGAGGGGGGGAVTVLSALSITGISITANGGDGGNQTGSLLEAQGPGGGGGGGYILSTAGVMFTSVNGGANGTNSSSGITEFPPNGATRGSMGTLAGFVPYTNPTAKSNLGITIVSGTPPECLNGSITYTVILNNQSCHTSSNVIANITIPVGINFTLSNPTSGIYSAPNWTIPAMPPGSSATLVLSGQVTATTVSPFSGTVSSLSNLECNLSNNIYSVPGFTVIEVVINTVPTAICIGAVATLSATGANTYTWSPGLLTGATPTVSPLVNTTYTVSGNIQSCLGSQTLQLVVNPIPTIAATGSPSFLCSGQTGTLNATGADSYTWLPYGYVGATFTVPIIGNVQYTVVGSNSFGCTNYTYLNMSGFTPTIYASPAIVCKGDSTVLYVSGGINYTWSPGGITGPSIVITPTAPYTQFTINATHPSGCPAFTLASVSIDPSPTVTAFANPTAICIGSTSFLNAFGAFSYYWLPPLNINSQTVVVSPTVTTTYTVVGYSFAGCPDTTTVQVIVHPEPTITAVPSPPAICRGGSSVLSATVIGASSYTWYPGGVMNNSIVVSPTVSSTYTVVTVNAFGCYNRDIIGVAVGPDIDAIALPDVVCEGQSSTLSASGGVSYTWSPGGITGATAGVTPSVTTSYTVIGIDAIGCADTATVSVKVNPLPDILAASIPTLICAGENVTLTASGADSFYWNPGNLIGDTIDLFLNTTTVFTVTGTNTTGCSDTKTVIVTVDNCTVNVPIGIAKRASIPESDGHDDFLVTFYFIITNYATFPVYNVQLFDDLTNTFLPPSTFTVVSMPVSTTGSLNTNAAYTGNGNNTNLLANTINSLLPGQSDTVIVRVKFSPEGISSFTNSAIVFASSQPTGGFSGTDVSNDGNNADPNNNNLPDEASEGIPTVFTAITDFFIPQGFSPNNDGVNDFFVIRGIKYYPNNEFQVLNRWGNVVYKKNGYANTWDGTTEEGIKIGGNQLPEGTYFYILHLGNGSAPYKGYLYLNRGLRE